MGSSWPLRITLNSLVGIGGPILISRGLDMLARRSVAPQAIAPAGAGVLLLGVAAWVFNYIQQWFSARVIGDVVLEIREDVFDATMRHDLSFFDDHPSGKIVSRITSDTQDFSDVVTLTMNLLSQFAAGRWSCRSGCSRINVGAGAAAAGRWRRWSSSSR